MSENESYLVCDCFTTNADGSDVAQIPEERRVVDAIDSFAADTQLPVEESENSKFSLP